MDSRDRTCATCRHWHRQGPQIANAKRDPSCPADQGTCQAHSAVVVPTGEWANSIFPRTHQNRWCGEWKPAGTAGPGGGEVVELRRAAA